MVVIGSTVWLSIMIKLMTEEFPRRRLDELEEGWEDGVLIAEAQIS